MKNQEFKIENYVNLEQLKKAILVDKVDFKTDFINCKSEQRKEVELFYQEKQYVLNKNFYEKNIEKLQELGLLKNMRA